MGLLASVRGALRDAVGSKTSRDTVRSAASSRQQEPDQPVVPPVEPRAVSFETYTVVTGDTLLEIGTRFGTPAPEIARLNGIDNPDLIFPGQVFRIPTS